MVFFSIVMKRIFSIILLFGYFSISLAQVPVDEIRGLFSDAESKVVLVAAHRAAHIHHPENSLPAIQEAIDIGVDIVELDVKVTKDGVPVLMHDGTIDRTTTGSGKPFDYQLEELRQFRLIHAGAITDHKIPTFEEALKLIKNKVLVDIDIKTDQLEPIIDVIKKVECEDQVFWFDNDYEALDYVRSVDKDFMLMPRAYSYNMVDSAILRFQPEAVHIDFSFYNEEVTELIKSNGARVWLNALGLPDVAIGSGNESKAIDKLLEFGANIIQTDKPDLLLKALRKRSLHP